ncbi:tRNA 2'-phosphotransferase 1 isoform X2 [Boleophthalmus pectinirostris]|uniref:tRNA 2'-phosphotransferase 1 isoform X2 n=1 Tax=Boleophthalmus pectinirostris TaxID=150288 RepID=UPI0024326C4B|nr:tRNA 2'-phosphotransferase 1 isoform X2 [Boleophthalmus pectinirostris]
MSSDRRKGRRSKPRGEDRDVQLSKSLSYVLRHGAYQMGFQMSKDGFLYVEDLLAHPQFRSWCLDDVKRVVESNDKQRFKLQPHADNGRLQIRANQGHSLQVKDLELKPVLAGSPDCPPEAVHGSFLRNWTAIQQHGLSRMKRTHIHLAPGLPGEEGVISDNGVLLTPGDTEGKLLPKYFSCALRLKPTRAMLPLH